MDELDDLAEYMRRAEPEIELQDPGLPPPKSEASEQTNFTFKHLERTDEFDALREKVCEIARERETKVVEKPTCLDGTWWRLYDKWIGPQRGNVALVNGDKLCLPNGDVIHENVYAIEGGLGWGELRLCESDGYISVPSDTHPEEEFKAIKGIFRGVNMNDIWCLIGESGAKYFYPDEPLRCSSREVIVRRCVGN